MTEEVVPRETNALTIHELLVALSQIIGIEHPDLPVLVGPYGDWMFPTTVTVTDGLADNDQPERGQFRALVINTGNWPGVVSVDDTNFAIVVDEEPAAPDNPAPEIG